MLVASDFDRTTPVLIIKMRHYMLHHGAVGAARSLGRVGVPVYAISEDRYTPLALSRYVSEVFQWSGSPADPGSALDDLHRFSKRIGRTTLLMATDDVAAMFLARYGRELGSAFITPFMDADLTRDLCNKRKLHLLCRQAGVPCPETSFPHSIEDVKAFIENATFPVMVKAAEANRLPINASSAAIAATPEQLLNIYKSAQSPDAPNLLLQEYIPQGSEDWIFHGYRSPESGCMVSFTGRKLRSWPPFAGPTTLGVSANNEVLKQQSEAFLREINYSGIMDLDYRLDHRDGRYKLLDFNPRVGANFRMFVDEDGLDVVRAMHLDLTGRAVDQKQPEEDRKLFVESYDFFASARYMRKGALTWSGWWQSLRGHRENAWLDHEDPVPFFAMWIRLAQQTAANRLRRRASSSLARDERDLLSHSGSTDAASPALSTRGADYTPSTIA
jgi:predicted ATP-grasp superfamily ATP-dependent carboligase